MHLYNTSHTKFLWMGGDPSSPGAAFFCRRDPNMAQAVPCSGMRSHPNQVHTMKRILLVSIVSLAGLAACGKTDTGSVDSALAVGATTIPFDSLSTIEQNRTAAGLAAPGPVVQAPAQTRPAPHRTTSARRSTSSSGSSSSGGATASAPAPTRTVIKKNTKRDAAIGAAAGAVIGATTSRDKVKGAVVGGVVGGVIGGVIGNNVDVQKKKR